MIEENIDIQTNKGSMHTFVVLPAHTMFTGLLNQVVLKSLIAWGLALANLLATAQTSSYPSKPVRIVVPFPAGGSADSMTRVVGQFLAKRWGQTVLVDNRPGGGTVIAGTLVAKAPADGYTLIVIANSLTINAKLRTNLPYDGLKTFDPIAQLVQSPQVIAVNSASPYTTLGEMIQAAKASPGALSYSTVGPATTQHIAGESFKRITGTDFTYVAFTGGALAANAVMGNHVTMVLTNLNEVAPMLESGKLRPLAVTTRERLDALKHVPTAMELGIKDYEAVAWFAIAAPAGTPKEVTQKIADDLKAALNDPEVRQKLNTAGLHPSFMGPEALSVHIQTEYQRYSKIIDEARIKLE
jgi:tripartite-type tricarboxylate transporter receptor subunit TctC